MDVVLGVSMAPTTVRMVLVEGEDAHGATVDHRCFDLTTDDAAASALAGILGTRDSAAEGGHRIVATGVVWNDPAAAARLKSVLRADSIDDVILVSELHAAGALAQAIGQAAGYGHTALMFLERDTATLAVVRAADGAVVKVASRSLHVPDAAAELQMMVVGLERLPTRPQALFMVGSVVDVAVLKSLVAVSTSLPVHIPEDAALALARGAALAAGGQVIGVIPGVLLDREAGHKGLARLEVVADMQVRKQRMIELSDAFLTLPGGLGTLDELFEVLTLRQLGEHQLPILAVNDQGYFDTLAACLREFVDHGLVGQRDLAALELFSSLDAALVRLGLSG